MLYLFPFSFKKIKHSLKPILAIEYVAGHMDDVTLLHMHIVDEHQPQFGSEKFCRHKLYIFLAMFYTRCLMYWEWEDYPT